MTGGAGYGAAIQNNGGTQIIDGLAEGNNAGAYMFALVSGSQQLGKGAKSNGTNMPACLVQGSIGTLTLMGGAYLSANGTGLGVNNTGGACIIRSYGAYGSAAVAGTVTVLGTYTVLP